MFREIPNLRAIAAFDNPLRTVQTTNLSPVLHGDHPAQAPRAAQFSPVDSCSVFTRRRHFLAAAGILGLSGGRYTLKPAPPLPAEALDLNNEERAREDKIRWHSLYERIGYDIIDLFDPDSQQTTTLKTTLERLGRETKANPESTRFGVLGLIEEGDFSANKDVARIEPHQVFELAVDWDKFNASRIGIGPTS